MLLNSLSFSGMSISGQIILYGPQDQQTKMIRKLISRDKIILALWVKSGQYRAPRQNFVLTVFFLCPYWIIKYCQNKIDFKSNQR